MKIARIFLMVLAVSVPANVFGQTKADVVSGSLPLVAAVQPTEHPVTWIPLRQLLFVNSTTPFIVSPVAVGGIEGVPVVSSLPVSTSTESTAADHGKATECYDWQNWKIRRYWGLWHQYKHEEKYDGDQLVPHNWSKFTVVRRQGFIHSWMEGGLAENPHFPCEDGGG